MENKNIFAIAIMDDFYILGPPKEVIRAYTFFAKQCAADGSLELNFKKGKLIYLHQKIWIRDS